MPIDLSLNTIRDLFFQQTKYIIKISQTLKEILAEQGIDYLEP